MRKVCLALGVAACFFAVPSRAEDSNVSDQVVKIGVLADMSGVYKDMSGPGVVEAVKMAVEDFGGSVLGRPIEVISADHQNKPDTAATIARRWYDVEKVDAIADVVGSASSLAVSSVASSRKRVALISNGATAELNGASCNAYNRAIGRRRSRSQMIVPYRDCAARPSHRYRSRSAQQRAGNRAFVPPEVMYRCSRAA